MKNMREKYSPAHTSQSIGRTPVQNRASGAKWTRTKGTEANQPARAAAGFDVRCMFHFLAGAPRAFRHGPVMVASPAEAAESSYPSHGATRGSNAPRHDMAPVVGL